MEKQRTEHINVSMESSKSKKTVYRTEQTWNEETRENKIIK